MNILHHRSKRRIRNLGEVFTPRKCIEGMFDLLEESVWSDENIIFFEPTCGHGNFVVAVAERRFNAFFKKFKYEKKKNLIYVPLPIPLITFGLQISTLKT